MSTYNVIATPQARWPVFDVEMHLLDTPQFIPHDIIRGGRRKAEGRIKPARTCAWLHVRNAGHWHGGV
jgi:hypothetical protein